MQFVFTIIFALFGVISIVDGFTFSSSFMQTLLQRRNPQAASKIRQYNSWKNQVSNIERQGGYAEYLKQQKLLEAQRNLEMERRKLMCTPDCRDELDVDLPGFCREVASNRECDNPTFKYGQCSFTCQGCTRCPPGYTPPTRKPKTTTAPPTTTTQEPEIVERTIIDGDAIIEQVCTEVELPCSNRIRRGCGGFFYRSCKSKRTKSRCQKYCGLCEKELVCKNVTKEIEEKEDSEEKEENTGEEKEIDGQVGTENQEDENVDSDKEEAAEHQDDTKREKKVDCDPECIDEITTCADLMEMNSSFCTDVWNISNKKCKASCKVCLDPCPVDT